MIVVHLATTADLRMQKTPLENVITSSIATVPAVVPVRDHVGAGSSVKEWHEMVR
jgi:hypothetical protein